MVLYAFKNDAKLNVHFVPAWFVGGWKNLGLRRVQVETGIFIFRKSIKDGERGGGEPSNGNNGGGKGSGLFFAN